MKKLIAIILLFPALAFGAEMTTRTPDNQNPSHYTETIADGENGETIRIVMESGAAVSCTIIAGANTGKIQYTTSSDAAITAGSETWQDWPNGDTTGTYSDALLAPVTALRGVSVSGEIVIEFTQ